MEFSKSITVADLLQVKRLNLELVCGKRYIHKEITVNSVGRPGLALCGHLDNFSTNSAQVLGPTEYTFCCAENKTTLRNNISKMLVKGAVPCVIMTAEFTPIAAVKKACLSSDVPVLKTDLEVTEFISEFSHFLDDKLAPITHVHGVLVDVSGIGVLIRGESGIGKSECALELIKRGHILVADDVVAIQRTRGHHLIGSCPTMLRHYMEVRGLGILDVPLLFGVGATLDETKIDMEVVLTSPSAQPLDRLGVEQKMTDILGVEIPSLVLPVTPGRNLAVLIEVASLNQQLKSQGIFSAKEFSQKILNKMSKKNDKSNSN